MIEATEPAVSRRIHVRFQEVVMKAFAPLLHGFALVPAVPLDVSCSREAATFKNQPAT